MSDNFAPFAEVLADRHGWIKKYKAATGKKVAGFFCDYLPEELFTAAGYVTVRVTGGRGNVIVADKYLQSNVCSFARRCLEQGLSGVFDYLDALGIPHTCDVITKMYDLWAYRKPEPEFLHYVWVPHKVYDAGAFAVMEGEVRRFKKSLEDHTGQAITDEALKSAIALHDRSRALLKRIYELRKTSPPQVSGVEAFSISLTSLLAPKEEHVKWMEAFLQEREGKPSALASRPRVLIAASMLDDLDLVKAVEDAGAWVVADDVCTGSRYFWDLIGNADADPVKAITRRYLNKIPCPRSIGSLPPRQDHIFNLIRDYGAEGVIFYILRCCDAHLFQYPLLNERLQQAGTRVLYLQGDQTVGINEGILNRIKAFTEMLLD